MNESLQTTLKKLRLSGLAQSLEVRLQEAAGNHLTHSEFLELILQDEMLVRNDRQIQRGVKTAAFRELKTLEDFDWQFNTSIKKKQIYDLASCRFLHEIVMFFSWGLPAQGKVISYRPLAIRLSRWGLESGIVQYLMWSGILCMMKHLKVMIR